MRRWTLVALAVLVVAGTAGVLFQITPSGDRTLTKVELQDDGDARVSIVTTIELPNQTEVDAFEATRDDFEDENSTGFRRFREAVVGTVERADATTDRSMRVTDVGVTTRIESLPVRRGIVEYWFVWEGFAARDGDRLRVADGLDGYVLDDTEALELVAPAGYVATDVSPEPDERRNGSVRWTGPRTFSEDRPRATVAPQGAVGPGDTGDDASGISVLPWAAVLVLVVAVAGGLYLYRRRSDAVEAPDMTDDERVIQMVEEAGGRLKQKQIGERTEWSAAKVSQVTSRLEDDGKIEKLRMGRENIIRFPDEDE